MARSRTGGVRTVIQLSDENAIAVFGALTPHGASAPPYGVTSSFFNQLVDEWRAKRALKETASGTATPA